jgi:hypothetical protein
LIPGGKFVYFAATNQLTGVEMDFIYTTGAVPEEQIHPNSINLIFEPMVNENEVLSKDHLKEIFTAENFGRMLERIDNMEKFKAKGMRGRHREGHGERRREEGMEKVGEARALTIGTFIRKMPDMPDGNQPVCSM